MQSHAYMIQPAISVVMHAQAKEPARDGTGTSTSTPNPAQETSARARTVRAVRAGASASRTSTLCSVDVPIDCAFRRLPCLQTRYIVESAADAPLRTQIDPAQLLASVGGGGRIPDPCLALFHLYGICKPFLIAGLGGPAHEKGRGRIPDISHLFNYLYDPASCLRPRNAGCCSSGLHPTSRRQGAEGRIPGPVS